jgi:hypothetical protein
MCVQVAKLLDGGEGGLDALAPQPGMEPGCSTAHWLTHCVVRGAC